MKNLILNLFVCCLLFGSSSSVSAQEPEYFMKVTSLDQLDNEDEIIFVNAVKAEGEQLYAMGADRGNNRGAISINPNGDIFEHKEGDGVQILKLRVIGSDYAFYAQPNGGFLYKNKESVNQLGTGEQSSFSEEPKGEYLWTIKTYDDALNGFSLGIYNNRYSYKIQFYKGNGNTIFSSYSSGTNRNIVFFKKAYSRSVYVSEPKQFGTICLAKNAVLNGATAYSIVGKRMDGENVKSIVLKEHEGELKAGVPYIFKADGDRIYALTYGEEMVENSANGLVGSINGTAVSEGMYLLSNDVIQKCGKNCLIAANRAYIDMDKVSTYTGEVSSSKNRIEITSDGVINSIDALDSGASSESAAVYTLTGVRASGLQRGINIVRKADGTVTKIIKK